MATKKLEGDLTQVVTMSKDGVEHEFVAESVPVWLDSGWKLGDDSNKEKAADKASPSPTKRAEAEAK
jgi:hypothetical protein